jgi:hypothetical protein
MRIADAPGKRDIHQVTYKLVARYINSPAVRLYHTPP